MQHLIKAKIGQALRGNIKVLQKMTLNFKVL
jgi:hypothetical protein